mmetsp:Transcript_15697/g.33171  ORF Transcript_15697/g.33171 Transcript_15697/m.33171 type:complete len:226 (-) Transcript_15697:794-1471(-)
MTRSPPHQKALRGELVEFAIQQNVPLPLLPRGRLLLGGEASHLPHGAPDDADARELQAHLGVPVREEVHRPIQDHAEEDEYGREDGGEAEGEFAEVSLVAIGEPRLLLLVVQDVGEGRDDGVGAGSGGEPQGQGPGGGAGDGQSEVVGEGGLIEPQGITGELRFGRRDLGLFVGQALLLEFGEGVGRCFGIAVGCGLEFQGIGLFVGIGWLWCGSCESGGNGRGG